MAEEIKGIKGDELIQETVVEIQEDQKKQKKKHKITRVFPSELVEGMFSQALIQLVHQMNSLFLIFHDKETGNAESFDTQKKKLDAIKGVHLIFCSELETIVHCLKPYSDAALNHKHRSVRSVIVEGFERMKDLGPNLTAAKYINNQYVTEFAKEMCQLVTNFHVTLHDKTPKKERSRIVKEYCDEC